MVFRKKKDKDKEPEEKPEKVEPFVVRPVRRRDPFDDFFTDFDKMEDMVNEIMRNMITSISKAQANKPYVYGFSMKTGPDGKPVISEFGNVKKEGKPVLSDAREPLVDVIDRDKDIIVIAELPGVEKKDIQLEVNKDVLEVKVDTPGKKYFKEVALPGQVEEDATDATYNNGILEVKLKRKKPKKGKGKKIEIK